MLERIDVAGVRHYKTPAGDIYPSITSVLSATRDNESILALEDWIDRVGHAEAAAITKEACRHGDAVHKLMEQHLLKTTEPITNIQDKDWDTFAIGSKHLSNISRLYGVEVPLYTDTLRVAGTADLICEWGGIPSVCDYKTMHTLKKKEWMTSYLLQASLYAYAFTERTGKPIEQVVLICMVTSQESYLVIEKVSDWLPEAINRVNKYYEH